MPSIRAVPKTPAGIIPLGVDMAENSQGDRQHDHGCSGIRHPHRQQSGGAEEAQDQQAW